MNSETQSPQSEVQKEGQGTASMPVPSTFNAAAMADVIRTAYLKIATASAKARPLKDAYIARMQKSAGYEVVPELKKESQGAAATALSMIADGELTPKGITRAVEQGLIRLVETKPDAALVSALEAYNATVKEFNGILSSASTPLAIALPTGKKNVNMPTGTRVRKPSKGFVSIDEWNAISTEEKVQYSMTYDEVGITLKDINGATHYCKAIGALGRHEQGEGHKASS